MALFTAERLRRNLSSQSVVIDGAYKAVRPDDHFKDRWSQRWKWAFLVLIGRLDVVRWYKQ